MTCSVSGIGFNLNLHPCDHSLVPQFPSVEGICYHYRAERSCCWQMPLMFPRVFVLRNEATSIKYYLVSISNDPISHMYLSASWFLTDRCFVSAKVHSFLQPWKWYMTDLLVLTILFNRGRLDQACDVGGEGHGKKHGRKGIKRCLLCDFKWSLSTKKKCCFPKSSHSLPTC